MIVFTDVETPPETKVSGKAKRTPASSAMLARMEQELQQCREELQTTREEMQTSQEELKSANEELQSTNEELTTSEDRGHRGLMKQRRSRHEK